MAAYTLTSANVLPSSSAVLIYGEYGGTVSAGQPVYRSSTVDSRGAGSFILADGNGSTATADVIGIAVNSGVDGTPAIVCTYDPDFTHGLTTVTKGDIIVVGNVAGALHPSTDLTSGWYPSIAMIATSSTKAVVTPVHGTATI